jgi:hypothetical protein
MPRAVICTRHLYCDDGELLSMVLRLHGGEDTDAYTVTPIGLRRLAFRHPPRSVLRIGSTQRK